MSGVASNGRCNIDQVPHRQATATSVKTRNLFRTENAMMPLIIVARRAGPAVRRDLSSLAWRICRNQTKLLVALVRAGQRCLATERLGLTLHLGWIL